MKYQNHSQNETDKDVKKSKIVKWRKLFKKIHVLFFQQSYIEIKKMNLKVRLRLIFNANSNAIQS
jgi:hypothetical protein